MARRLLSPKTAITKTVPKGSRVLVAVSGGKDSVALLHALYMQRALLKLKLEVAHVDHALRSTSSDDAEFVQKLCHKYGLLCHQKRLKPPAEKVNVENWGRKQRYAFFKKLIKELDMDYVVTAHHSDDFAETFLMRLVSNKELRGITGHDAERRILRPFLDVSRDSIEKFIKDHKLEFREDQTNSDQSFLRNKVRLSLLPQLKSLFNKNCALWISQQAKILDEDSKCLDEIAISLLKNLSDLSLGSEQFRQTLRNCHLAVACRILEFCVLERFGFRIGRARAKMLYKLVQKEITSCDMPNDIRAYWSKGDIKFEGIQS